MFKLVFALVTAVTAVTAFAADCTPPKVIGLDYHAARVKLIQAGCRPVAYKPADEGNPPIEAMRKDAVIFGYYETGIVHNSGRRLSTYKGFSVSMICEDLADTRFPCKVDSIKHH